VSDAGAPPDLLPQHAALIEASSIKPDVASARGYRSVTIKADLKRLGFSDFQRHVPCLLIPAWDVHGEIATYQIRPDTPRIGKKGKPIKYETPKDSRLIIDVPPAAREWLGDPKRPLFVTEGARKADCAVSRGLCCVAILGVWNWRGRNQDDGLTALADWEAIALKGREVYIAFDGDVVTKIEVWQALRRLQAFLESRGADVRVIRLPVGEGGAKVGLDDYLAAGHSVQDLVALVNAPEPTAAPESAGIDHAAAASSDGASQATRMIDYVESARVELFHDDLGEAWGRVEVDEHFELWRCRSKQFKRWLAHLFWKREGAAPNSDAVSAALGVIEAKARFEGPEHTLHNRVALHDGAIWYDLSDPDWKAVRVSPDGWEIVSRPPILFRRHAHQRPQVVPVAGGDLHRLLALVNLQDLRHRLLLLVYVVSALVPDIPHVIVIVHGPQGAAKTTLLRMLRRIIDPSITETLSIPKDQTELVQQLSHHWTPFYDNLTTVPDWLSDALCRAVTGEGFSKRELYTDDEDIIYSFRRCCGMTGINIAAHKADLLDRSLLFGLEDILPAARKPERAFWDEFDSMRPALVGAAFDALSRAMRLRPEIALTRLPRMADFALWGCAITESLGHGRDEFLRTLDANFETRNEEILTSNPVATAIAAMMEDQEDWEGSASELLTALDKLTAKLRVDTRSKAWPKAANSLGRRLNEIHPNLAAVGIAIRRGERTGDRRLITIRRVRAASIFSTDGPPGHDDADDDPELELSQVPSSRKCWQDKTSDDHDSNDGISPHSKGDGDGDSPTHCLAGPCRTDLVREPVACAVGPKSPGNTVTTVTTVTTAEKRAFSRDDTRDDTRDDNAGSLVPGEKPAGAPTPRASESRRKVVCCRR